MQRSCDIFCSVVDNYGDIGVCWRLARQMAADSTQAVRLWVDDLASFQRLCPAVDPACDVQRVQAVEVCRWAAQFPAVEPAAIVIEGFGVRLPDSYVAAMAEMKRSPVWINLEHISAEPWVDEFHAMPSRHPALPLTKYFFFPGFTAQTGGLLVERDLVTARSAFQADAHARAEFLHALGVHAADKALLVSLFCYENAALGELVDAWVSGDARTVCMVPAGKAHAALASVLGTPVAAGMQIVRGQLTVAAIPFLDLDTYDRLLWACDVNFVRGEDSFVRAQLSARPLIWQAYVQTDDAHLVKQTAFLDRYLAGLDADTARAWRALHEAWNRQSSGTGRCWTAFMQVGLAAGAHANAWAASIAAGRHLATKLAEFCEDRLK